jgi:ribonuclease PH
MDTKRENNRSFDAIRPLSLKPHYLDHADGSVLIEMGKTKVIAAASTDEKVPPFLKGTGQGWVTAEYAMLPRATGVRNIRERVHGRISGRSQEIQRLIGRSLRAVTDLDILGERTVIIDCDVVQADGGTRSASITAGCVALALALKKLMDEEIVDEMPLKNLAAGISLGIVNGTKLLDLDYREDFNAELDMNVVETDTGRIIEIQATAEKDPFTRKDLTGLLTLATKGIKEIIDIQKSILIKESVLFMAYG